MADETFGVSIVEAQASGLPVVGVAAGAMVDRVPCGLGLVGKVDDADVMAINILAVLNGDREAIGERARDHALQFSWDQSMECLFGRVYRSALARAAVRATGTAGGTDGLAGRGLSGRPMLNQATAALLWRRPRHSSRASTSTASAWTVTKAVPSGVIAGR